MTVEREVERTASAELRTLLAEMEATELRLFKLGYTELMKKVYAARLDISQALRAFESWGGE